METGAGLSPAVFELPRKTGSELLEFLSGEEWIGVTAETDRVKAYLDRLAVELLLPDLLASGTTLSLELRLARLEAERLRGSIAEFEWTVRKLPTNEDEEAYLSSRAKWFQACLKAFSIMSGQL